MRFLVRAILGALTGVIITMITRHFTKEHQNDYVKP